MEFGHPVLAITVSSHTSTSMSSKHPVINLNVMETLSMVMRNVPKDAAYSNEHKAD